MIVGHGDIAQALRDLDNPAILFFASGVSNSRETRMEQFKRELDMLEKYTIQRLHIAYFSSLSVYYSNTVYAEHKREVEGILSREAYSWSIIRLGNITWGNNPNTIINYFKSCYQKGIEPKLQDTYRHIVGRQEFEYWIKKIRPGINDIMNIPGEFIHVKEIWRRVTNGEY